MDCRALKSVVLPFTAIEGKRNALGMVFRIHRGETVGFP